MTFLWLAYRELCVADSAFGVLSDECGGSWPSVICSKSPGWLVVLSKLVSTLCAQHSGTLNCCTWAGVAGGDPNPGKIRSSSLLCFC